MDKIKDDWPGIEAAINAAHTSHSEGLAAYLSYMGIRLIEMHRVLKDTGSLYLHCDDTASHYLKMLLDAIFETTYLGTRFCGRGSISMPTPSVLAGSRIGCCSTPRRTRTPSIG